jgi:hypothetical protein
MHTPHDNLTVALDALGMGYAPIPVVEGTKVPAVKWKEWQTRLPPEDLVREWFSVRRNVALVATGLVVFDCDDPAKAELVLAECGDTPDKVKTPRGLHLTYRARLGVVLHNQVNVKGLAIDLRTNGGLRLIPNSQTEHGGYEWLGALRPAAELPVAKIGWTRERARRRLQSLVVESSPDVMVRRARAYLACVEGAVSGQGGHRRTFRVACKLTHPSPRGFGLGVEQALPLLKEWSEASCEPPWSDAELLHKLKDAIKKR